MLEELRAKGDILGYSTKLSLRRAADLINIFNTQNAHKLKDAEKYTKGDVIVAEIERTLTEQRQAYAIAQNKPKKPDTGYERVGSYLTDLVGSYREFKQSRSLDAFNDMVRNYNEAVNNVKDLR